MENVKKTFVDPFAHISTEQLVRNFSFWLHAMMSRGIALDQAIPTDAVPAPTEDKE